MPVVREAAISKAMSSASTEGLFWEIIMAEKVLLLWPGNNSLHPQMCDLFTGFALLLNAQVTQRQMGVR